MTRRHRWTNLAPALRRDGLVAEVTAAGAELMIYDYIDSWGGEWGVSAADVLVALDAMGDVGELSVRLNSPGGDYFEGVAIYNALVRHRAQVTVHVDALAASAASVIAMAGNRIVMGTGSQLMIHEARSGIFGATADDMRAQATMLDQTNDDIAGFYAARSGGDIEQWRQAVATETWYTAAQAVEAGLADEIAQPPSRGNAPAAVAVSAEQAREAAARVLEENEAARIPADVIAELHEALDCLAPCCAPQAPAAAAEAPPAEPAPTDSAPAFALPTNVNLAELISSTVRK